MQPHPAPIRFVTVGEYAQHAEAQRAIDHLADQGFPVERARIVGSDLAFVEDVTGRRTVWRAVLDGAFTGGIIGIFLGFIVGIFDLVQPLVSAFELSLWGLGIGLLGGALVGLIGFVLTRDRDFTSVGRIEAERYRVQVLEPHASDALKLIST